LVIELTLSVVVLCASGAGSPPRGVSGSRRALALPAALLKREGSDFHRPFQVAALMLLWPLLGTQMLGCDNCL
jgi:hypothetical protein